MDSNRTRYLSAENTSLYGTLYNIFAKKNIINIGIITSVIDENTINVRLYDSDDSGKVVIINAVRLLHLGTSKCRVIINPAVGDNVLLLASRDYIKTLEYNHNSEPKEINVEAYSNSTVQAILISPDETDNVLTNISIDENGSVDFVVKDSSNTIAELKVENSGAVTISTKDNNVIKMGTNGVVINNNLSVSN